MLNILLSFAMASFGCIPFVECAVSLYLDDSELLNSCDACDLDECFGGDSCLPAKLAHKQSVLG